MTRLLFFFEGETVSDIKPVQEGAELETRQLWSIHLQADDSTWVELGTPNADAAAILRTYDYRLEHFPEEKIRIARTEVTISVEDVDILRHVLAQEQAQKTGNDLQSE